MLCQNCKINDSTIHLYTNINGQQKQIDLCQNCYKIIKTDPNNTLFKGMTDLNNHDFDPFGDFFNDLNNFNLLLITSLQLNLVGDMEETVIMDLKTVAHFKHLLAKKEDSLRNTVSILLRLLVGEILTLLSVEMKRLSALSKSSTVEPRTTLSLSENQVLVKQPLLKV